MNPEVMAVIAALALFAAQPAAFAEERENAGVDLPAILNQIDAVNRFSDSHTALMGVASCSPEEAPAMSAVHLRFELSPSPVSRHGRDSRCVRERSCALSTS